MTDIHRQMISPRRISVTSYPCIGCQRITKHFFSHVAKARSMPTLMAVAGPLGKLKCGIGCKDAKSFEDRNQVSQILVMLVFIRNSILAKKNDMTKFMGDGCDQTHRPFEFGSVNRDNSFLGFGKSIVFSRRSFLCSDSTFCLMPSAAIIRIGKIRGFDPIRIYIHVRTNPPNQCSDTRLSSFVLIWKEGLFRKNCLVLEKSFRSEFLQHPLKRIFDPFLFIVRYWRFGSRPEHSLDSRPKPTSSSNPRALVRNSYCNSTLLARVRCPRFCRRPGSNRATSCDVA
jgi:hypothetical protein